MSCDPVNSQPGVADGPLALAPVLELREVVDPVVDDCVRLAAGDREGPSRAIASPALVARIGSSAVVVLVGDHACTLAGRASTAHSLVTFRVVMVRDSMTRTPEKFTMAAVCPALTIALAVLTASS